MNTLIRLLRYIRPYGLIATGASFSLIMATIFMLINPLLLRWIIDSGVELSNLRVIIIGAVSLVFIAILRGLFNFLQSYWSEMTSQSVAFDVRNDLFAKIQSLSFSYLDRAQTGQLMTRITSDVDLVRQFTGNGLFQLVNALLMLIGVTFILFSMNWQLALITIATTPLMLLALGRFMVIIRPLFELIQAKLATINTIIQENIAGIRVVKAFSRENFEISHFQEANEDYLRHNIKAGIIFATNFPLIFLFQI